MAWKDCASAICNTLNSAAVPETSASQLHQQWAAFTSLRVALAGVVDRCILLTSDLKEIGPMKYSVHEARHSCCGRVIYSGRPYLCNLRSKLSDLKDLQEVSSSVEGSGFFCVPILSPGSGPPAVAALLAEFTAQDIQCAETLKPSLLLANELSQHFGQELNSLAAVISQALLPPEHGPGWGLDLETNSPPSCTSDSSDEEAVDAAVVDHHDFFHPDPFSDAGSDGQMEAALGMGGSERLLHPAVLHLLHHMSCWSLRFQEPAAEAAYLAWRHSQLVKSDLVRLLGLLLCQLIYIAPMSQHSWASGKAPVLLLLLLLWLRLLGGSPSGWFFKRRNWLMALVYICTSMDWSWQVPPLLGRLPSDTCRERAFKIVLVWMLGTGTAFQVALPWHAVMLLLTWLLWTPAARRLCGVMRPLEWLPGCMAITALKMLLCSCVLPLMAVYFSEFKGRQLWAQAAWQGHQHVH